MSTGLVPGFEANLKLNLNGLDFIEARYLGMLEWSTDNFSANVATPPDDLTVQQNFGARYFDIQFNHIRRLQDSPWEVLWGMRYCESNDAANARVSGQFDPGTGVIPVDLSTSYRAENELFGLQIGTQRSWNCESISFFTGVKGGIFYNSILQSGPQFAGTIDLETFPTAIGSFREAADEISFMGDFEASVQYAVTQYTLLSIGYRGIGLSDISQASRHNGAPSAPSALWFNGAFVSAEIFW